jgi:hypothetical protein
MKRKVFCKECDWRGDLYQDALCEANPFDRSENIYGCPKCKSVEQFAMACDYNGCWKEVTGGFSTPDGYRNTCYMHGEMLRKEYNQI